MTGSPVRTAVGGGLVACGLLLTGAGGLFAAVAAAEPDPGTPPGHSAGPDPAPDQAPADKPGASDDSPPAKDPADASDDNGDADPPAAAGDNGTSDTGGDVRPGGARPPSAGRPVHGGHSGPRSGPADDDADDPEPPSEHHGVPPGDQPGLPPIVDGTGDPVDLPTPAPAAPPIGSPQGAYWHHHDPDDPNDGDDEDDCGWPSGDAFWRWLISLFTPRPGTGVGSPGGGSGGGGPQVPSAPIPGSPGWSGSPEGIPPDTADIPERGGIGADVEPPVAVPAPAPAPPAVGPIPAPIVVGPPAAAPPRPRGPAIAVPARPNSTETQNPPTRPELPARSPTTPSLPDGFRVGYATYLRSASIGEVASLAGLGVSGLAALTAFGGLIGFRQAKAGLAVRAAGTARFLQ